MQMESLWVSIQMNDEKLEIENNYDLLNLNKALLEAKFHRIPYNIEVCFSPIIARISNEIVDLLINNWLVY